MRSGRAIRFIPKCSMSLTSKTATLSNFQRVRGMLRILDPHDRAHMGRRRPPDATAIHLHHIDVGYAPILQEIVTRASAVGIRAGDPK